MSGGYGCPQVVSSEQGVTVVDLGSFVLPFDYYFVRELAKTGMMVKLFCSNTQYNDEFLDALKQTANVEILSGDISSTLGKSKMSRMTGYLGLVGRLVKARRSKEWVLYQFTPLPIIDLTIMAVLRRRLVFVCHNAIPHGYRGRWYWAHQIAIKLAREVWCPSGFTKREVISRYWVDESKVHVVQHGKMGIVPGAQPVKFRAENGFDAMVFWGTVKPYKGVEDLRELAENAARGGNALPKLEIFGKWDHALGALKNDLREMGVTVVDEFLSPNAVENLFRRRALFLLTHRGGSQSGVLYTLLFYGKMFLARDVGDTGEFLRSHGLGFLLVEGFGAAEIWERLKYLRENPRRVAGALNDAAEKIDWMDVGERMRKLVDS